MYCRTFNPDYSPSSFFVRESEILLWSRRRGKSDGRVHLVPWV